MAQNSGWQSPGYSNHNLLINWDFRHPVNRRGKSNYTGAGFTIDTWWLQSSTELNLNTGYITVSGLYDFKQTLATALDEGIYTISAKYKDAKGNMVLRVSDEQNIGMWDMTFDAENGLTATTFNAPRKIKYISVFGNGEEISKIDLYAVKLELGAVSTLHADILNPIPYEYRLLRCLQYDLEGNYIGAVAASNPNLLINWDFRQPVNQRGQSSYTGVHQAPQYTIDMWRRWNNADITVSNGRLIINGTISQEFEQEPDFETKAYTFSVADANGVISSIRLSQVKAEYVSVTDGISVAWGTDSGCKGLFIVANNKSIQAIKLEVGTVSTLALDLMQPSNYANELHKCQRYFYRQTYNINQFYVGIAIATYDTRCFLKYALPVEMRISPTISYGGLIVMAGNFSNGQNDRHPISRIVVYGDNNKKEIILATDSTTNDLIHGNSYLIYGAAQGAYIEFSAEL